MTLVPCARPLCPSWNSSETAVPSWELGPPRWGFHLWSWFELPLASLAAQQTSWGSQPLRAAGQQLTVPSVTGAGATRTAEGCRGFLCVLHFLGNSVPESCSGVLKLPDALLQVTHTRMAPEDEVSHFGVNGGQTREKDKAAPL